ncbi:MAG: 4Fe-4S binding protein [Zestosphaera sp.]
MTEERKSSLNVLEDLFWVVIHGRGVWHTGSSTTLARVLAMAGVVAGRESYYYMRYDDSPERVNIPMMFYVVMGNPRVEVLLPEEVEPVGRLFNAVVVMDSVSLLKETSQRATLFDGIKDDAVFVVNTGLTPSQVLALLKKYQLTRDWFGKLVTVSASKYHTNVAFGLIGALLKAWNVVGLEDVLNALEALKIDEGAGEAIASAYKDASVTEVRVRAEESEAAGRVSVKTPEFRPGPWSIETYREYQRALSQARSYEDRIRVMPRWEAMAPGLIEFGPLPGGRNIGFKTEFARIEAPVIDKAKCVDCKLCTYFCPDGSIDFESVEVDYEYCKGCGICARVCPAKAIRMVSELERVEGLEDPELRRLALVTREYGY